MRSENKCDPGGPVAPCSYDQLHEVAEHLRLRLVSVEATSERRLVTILKQQELIRELIASKATES